MPCLLKKCLTRVSATKHCGKHNSPFCQANRDKFRPSICVERASVCRRRPSLCVALRLTPTLNGVAFQPPPKCSCFQHEGTVVKPGIYQPLGWRPAYLTFLSKPSAAGGHYQSAQRRRRSLSGIRTCTGHQPPQQRLLRRTRITAASSLSRAGRRHQIGLLPWILRPTLPRAGRCTCKAVRLCFDR